MFQFKQFTIQQDRTAMKVCTDACVLGAYTTPDRLHLATPSPAILDIGTGTGLLALMAAQNHPDARIDAIEIDTNAYGQAKQNVTSSPFADRIRVHHIAIQQYQPEYQYDLILTNPPFFTNHLRSPDAAANRALHTDTLPFADLVAAANRLLHPTGQWWVLLPPYETSLLDSLTAQAGLFPFEQLSLRHNAHKAPFRQITGYRRSRDDISFREMSSLNRSVLRDDISLNEIGAVSRASHTLTIYEANPTDPARERYTQPFRELLRPFYLIF